jgi:hypothetical protein
VLKVKYAIETLIIATLVSYRFPASVAGKMNQPNPGALKPSAGITKGHAFFELHQQQSKGKGYRAKK